MRLPVLCVLIVGGAIGFSLPADLPAGGPRANGIGTFAHVSDAPSSDLHLSAAQTAKPAPGWGGEVALPREGDGHFYADVHVDGVPARMMVDTGASVIALTGGDAQAMGLYWSDADVAPVAQGASGPVYGVRTTLPRVRVGEFEAQDVDAIIVPSGLGISLLGQSFLGTIGDVRIADDQMLLGSAH